MVLLYLCLCSAKVDRLIDVYTDAEALEAKRTWAVLIMVSFFRRVCRIRRYKRYEAARSAWRRLHAPEVIQVLTYEIKRQRYLNTQMQRMALQRTENSRARVFMAWSKLTKLHLPRIRRIMQFVENSFQAKQKEIRRSCFKAWWIVSSGPQSCRWKIKLLHERQHKARGRLQAQNDR